MFGLALFLALKGQRTWLIYNANQADFEQSPELCLCSLFGMNPSEFAHVLADAHIQVPHKSGRWPTTRIEMEYSLVIFPGGGMGVMLTTRRNDNGWRTGIYYPSGSRPTLLARDSHEGPMRS
jgi:hypothetical protein